MYVCLECGKQFKSTKAAERASSNGCPGCGGVDIDVDVGSRRGVKDAQKECLALEQRVDSDPDSFSDLFGCEPVR